MAEVVTSQPSSSMKEYIPIKEDQCEKDMQELKTDESKREEKLKARKDSTVEDCCCYLREEDFFFEYVCCRFLSECFVGCGHMTDTCCDRICCCPSDDPETGCCDVCDCYNYCGDCCSCGDCDCGDCNCGDCDCLS